MDFAMRVPGKGTAERVATLALSNTTKSTLPAIVVDGTTQAIEGGFGAWPTPAAADCADGVQQPIHG
jgi:hypothetical protein